MQILYVVVLASLSQYVLGRCSLFYTLISCSSAVASAIVEPIQVCSRIANTSIVKTGLYKDRLDQTRTY